ncbi:DUF2303 family protein [Oxalobacter paraformigenes]|uniref:DUF2303 family protein n=1 Tax=Oxalobacter paraformigenes TaxID=556268 RepID=C3X3A4_9BURK|nr:DUF2303 family protein [Oxalobacter paraformigenes]EEO27690.1 hypothetical protein OFAG_00843 [Oxalobacter paraformigenes]
MDEENKNIAETIFENAPKPITLFEDKESQFRKVVVPNGWEVQDCNDEKLLAKPRRKKAAVELIDTDSFIGYVKRHGSSTSCTIWADIDYSEGKAKFRSIINDHGEKEDEQAWRDHVARYTPQFSQEYRCWIRKNGSVMSQVDFAEFIDNNQADIASPEGYPSSAEMLNMALNFEAKQDYRFKSSVRLQNGGVNMTFIQDDDKGTIEQMKVFDKFAIGIPVYFGGDAYQINARLRYRHREGKVEFWYELVRPDLVMKAATDTIIERIKAECGQPFFFGNPFAA